MTPAAVPPGNWRAVMEAGEQLAASVLDDDYWLWTRSPQSLAGGVVYECRHCDAAIIDEGKDAIEHDAGCPVLLARHFQAVKEGEA